MGVWLAVICGSAIATALFLLACVSPKGNSVLTRTRHFVFAAVPSALQRTMSRLLGPAFYPALRYYLTYPFDHLTPLFQVRLYEDLLHHTGVLRVLRILDIRLFATSKSICVYSPHLYWVCRVRGHDHVVHLSELNSARKGNKCVPEVLPTHLSL
jgi:hypothetical protein